MLTLYVCVCVFASLVWCCHMSDLIIIFQLALHYRRPVTISFCFFQAASPLHFLFFFDCWFYQYVNQLIGKMKDLLLLLLLLLVLLLPLKRVGMARQNLYKIRLLKILSFLPKRKYQQRSVESIATKRSSLCYYITLWREHSGRFGTSWSWHSSGRVYLGKGPREPDLPPSPPPPPTHTHRHTHKHTHTHTQTFVCNFGNIPLYEKHRTKLFF